MALIELGTTELLHQQEIKKQPKTMLSHTTEGDKHTIRMNASSLSILQQCWQKANLALFQKLVSKTESPATLFGSAIHSALEVFYSGTREERVIPPKFKQDMEIIHSGAVDADDEFLLYRATKAFINRAAALESLPAEDKRSIANGVWTLRHYFENFINDPYHVYCDENGPITERRMESTIYDTPTLKVIIFGTVDVILEHEHTKEIIVCDHKTSSVVGNDFYTRIKPNHQYTGYVMLAQEVLGIDTDKFLVNCVQVKARPKTARGLPPHFPRQVTVRNEEDMEEYKKTAVYFAQQYVERVASGFWPMGDVNSCSMYGGCGFLNVCSSPNSIKQNIISANYITREDEA